MKHPLSKRILAPAVPYVPAIATDIRKTFERIKREQREAASAQPWRDPVRAPINLGETQ